MCKYNIHICKSYIIYLLSKLRDGSVFREGVIRWSESSLIFL